MNLCYYWTNGGSFVHIPDGLMDPYIILIGWVIAIIALAIATKTVNKRLDKKQIPLMATLAAGIFVAQMLNFPVGGGTTGHLVGAALAAILLGPYVGLIIITVILIIQCLLFGDGGITALGLNVVNMGVIGCFIGWYVYKAFPKNYKVPAIIIASWSAVLIGAIVCAIELAISSSISGGAYGIAASISIPLMTIYHIFIGLGEAIITTGIITYISQVSPEILRIPKIMLRSTKEEAILNA
jgi:cobalt/nickel transport system permease protein